MKKISLAALIVTMSLLLPQASMATVLQYYSSTNWTVPAGLTAVDLTLIAGGGGGGGSDGSGDNKPGGGGGSGGWVYKEKYAVTPGTALSITIGGGGAAGIWTYNADPNQGYATNGEIHCPYGTGTRNGNPGGDSTVSSSGSTYVGVGGGGGGGGNMSDGWIQAYAGAGGLYNGTPGQVNTTADIRNNYYPMLGGWDATLKAQGNAYGKGGDSNGWAGFWGNTGVVCPSPGWSGFAQIVYELPAAPTFSPSTCTAQSDGTFNIQMSFSGVSGAVNYPLRIQKSGGVEQDAVTTSSPYTFTGQTAGTYSTWGHAYNAYGWSAAASGGSVTCTAPTNGACGTANGVTFADSATGYGTYTQCSSGTPSTTAFPSQGSTQTWTCSSTSGGSPSGSCSASRLTAPRGYLDTADCSNITGWAYDPDAPSTSISVDVYRGGAAGSGTLVGRYTTSTYRSDVNASYSITGNHGYTIPVDSSFKTGTNQTVYVYAIDSAGGTNTNPLLTNSPKTINCTSATAPTVTTAAATSISQTGATSGGNITSAGTASVTASGIQWGTTTAYSGGTITSTATSGSWSSSITGLSAGTAYHVRAYATNSVGTAYGNDVSFTTTSAPSCSATHYGCNVGTSGSNTNGASAYTWTCTSGTSINCSEAKYAGLCSTNRYACVTGSVSGTGQTATDWTWSCLGNGGGDAACSKAKVLPTTTFAATSSVAYGGRAGLTWSSQDATSCTAGTSPWSPGTRLSGSGLTDPLTATTTFTFECTNTEGSSGVKSATVVVGPAAACTSPWGGADIPSGTNITAYQAATVVAPASCVSESRSCTNGTLSGSYQFQSCAVGPSVTFTANPTSINPGESSRLTWNASGATSCTGTGFSTGNLTSGHVDVTPSITSSYSITCKNAANVTATANTTVTVLLPTLSISAQPNRVKSGDSSLITWNATNVKTCSITRNGAAWKSGSSNASKVYAGSQSNAITAQTAFVLSCTDVSGNPYATTATVVVNLAPGFQEF